MLSMIHFENGVALCQINHSTGTKIDIMID